MVTRFSLGGAIIPGLGTLASCKVCGRKILIERGTAGSDHTVSTVIRCWDHLTPEHQEEAIRTYRFNIEATS
jgi:hypothetical protein